MKGQQEENAGVPAYTAAKMKNGEKKEKIPP